MQVIAIDFVEAEAKCRVGGHRTRVDSGEVLKELLGGQGEVSHSAFEEIAGQRRLRSDNQPRRIRPFSDLFEHLSQACQVPAYAPLSGRNCAMARVSIMGI